MWTRFLIVSFVFLQFCSFAQDDLFNLQNSLKYARYLGLTKQITEASNEYERVFFMVNGADSVSEEVFRFLVTNSQFEKSNKLFTNFYLKNKKTAPYKTNKYYLSGLLLSDKRTVFDEKFKTIKLNNSDFQDLKFTSELLDNKLTVLADIQKLPSKSELLTEYEKNFQNLKLKRKSPALAATFSAIIPGTGKVYSNSWKDGLMSFIFVTSSAYQSYRGFKKTGIKSGIGWAFGGVAFGFYTGNIYGSYKAAKKYNNAQQNVVKKKIESIFKRYI